MWHVLNNVLLAEQWKWEHYNLPLSLCVCGTNTLHMMFVHPSPTHNAWDRSDQTPSGVSKYFPSIFLKIVLLDCSFVEADFWSLH